ncbi:MAG: molybdate ABC transporter substrate-binding protein [Slackia sp.]|nr:molybdate ABC transporter substrate-binding protein [Slackia sp.]
MTMKKRVAAFASCAIACAMVSAAMLAGCSKPAEEPVQDADVQAQGESVQLQIFAANSLSKALDEVQALYTEKHPEVTFADTQYKASGELVEMLKAGSAADIFISASKGKMDDAAAAGLVDEATTFDMFTNDLVMVTGESNADIPEGLTLEQAVSGDYTICVGDESVPAGNYACQALASVGAYSDASGKGGQFEGTIADKVVLDTSVGNVCKHAESGDVDIAFVYSSDVYRFGGVKVLSTIPAETHKNIVYPAALTADSAHAQEAQEFLDWAASDPAALSVWQKWGFELA